MSTISAEKSPLGEIRQSNLVDPYLVTLEAHDDPQNMAALRRWIAVLVISSGALCVTAASSVASNLMIPYFRSKYFQGCFYRDGCR